jgi:CRP/FNR family cyclic AMP-dependent transcriptional regulator
MNDSTTTHAQADSGVTAAARNEKIFQPGSAVFNEGETSTEMYLIQAGQVRIVKQEGDNIFELATLGRGSVMGELSLLDHQPRSATAVAIEKTTVAVIDEILFSRTLAEIPPWLTAIIKVIVSRLRETIKKTGDYSVRQNTPGVIRVLTLFYDNEGFSKEGLRGVPLKKAKELLFDIIGLSSMDIDAIIRHLARKKLLAIRKNADGEDWVAFPDINALKLYKDWLRARQAGNVLPGENLTQKTRDLVAMVLMFREKKQGDPAYPYFSIDDSRVVVDVKRAGSSVLAEIDLFQELVDADLISRHLAAGEDTRNRIVFDYDAERLKRIHLLAEWQAVFREE